MVRSRWAGTQEEGQVQRGGARGGRKEALNRLRAAAEAVYDCHRAREVGQRPQWQQGQGRVGLWQLDQQEHEGAVQEYR